MAKSRMKDKHTHKKEVKPKRILLRWLTGLLIVAAILFPAYWFGVRAMIFRSKVRGLVSVYFDTGKPNADREEARDEILRLGKNAVPTLIHELETNKELTYPKKGAVVLLLKHIGDPRAVGGIIRSIVNDTDHLENLKKTGYFGKMMEAANKAERQLQLYDQYIGKVAGALAGIGHPQIPKLVRKYLGDRDEFYRVFAIRTLGMMKSTEDVDALVRVLRDGGVKEEIRAEAATALGLIGDIAASPALIEALKYKEAGIQFEAAIALGNVGDGSAVKPLVALLNAPPFSKAEGLDNNIVTSLGTIGGPEAYAELTRIYRDPNTPPALRETAREAIQTMVATSQSGS